MFCVQGLEGAQAIVMAYLVPVLLVIGKFLELLRSTRVLCQVYIALEPEDALGGIGVQCLLVKVHIPGAWRAILWVAGASGINEALLGSGVRSDEGDQVQRTNRHVLETADQDIGALKRAGEQSVRSSDRRVLSAHKGPHSGAQRANNGSDGRAHLEEVRHAHAILAVGAVPRLHLRDDILYAAVVRPLHLRRGKHNAAISAAQRTGGLGPASSIVEPDTNSLASKIVATAGVALELGGHVVGNVLPDAAGVGGTLGGTHLGDVRVCGGGLAALLVRDDVLDRLASSGQFAIRKSDEITNELGRVADLAGFSGSNFVEHLVHTGVGVSQGCHRGVKGEESGQLHFERLLMKK